MSGRVVICGIGNEFRCDDGAGPLVARAAAAKCPGTPDVGPLGEPLELLGRFENCDLAVVVDATRSGAPSGTLVQIDLTTLAGVDRGATSTHGIGVVSAIGIARALGRAPRRVVLVGIEGARFESGTELSPGVRAALPAATLRVVELVRESS